MTATSQPGVGLADQLMAEIVEALCDVRVRRALEARQGRLVLDWANGHLTYVEPQMRLKVGADLRARGAGPGFAPPEG